MCPSTWLKASVRTSTGPKSLYLICVPVAKSLLLPYYLHKPQNGKNTQTHGLKPLCVFKWSPMTFNLIGITVTGGEGYLSHDFL